MHLEALSFSNRYGLDGAIPRAALSRLTTEPDPEASAAALVSAGIWETTDEGWQLVWLLDDQPKAADVQRERAEAKERMRGVRDRERRHKRGDHSLCDPARCWVLRSPARSPERSSARSGSPSPPVPSRPKGGGGTGEGQAGVAGSADALTGSAPAPDEEPDMMCDRCGASLYAALGDTWVDPDPNDEAETELPVLCQPCEQHRKTTDPTVCLAFKKDGFACGQRAVKGRPWCLFHQTEAARGTSDSSLFLIRKRRTEWARQAEVAG